MTLIARIDELARSLGDAQKRLRIAQGSEHAIRAERDRIIRALAETGTSQRSIGALIGITSASVKAILDHHPDRPLPLAVLRRAEVPSFLATHPDQPQPVETIVAANTFDLLLSGWLSIEAYARGNRLAVPPMLLRLSTGEVIGVSDVLAGRPGRETEKTANLLRDLGFADDVAISVTSHAHLHATSEGILPATSEKPRTLLSARTITVTWTQEGTAMFNALTAVEPSRWQQTPRARAGALLDDVADWLHLLDRTPPVWARGTRAARVYLTQEAISAAGLDATISWDIRPATYSAIIEQGRLQLAVACDLPEPGEVMSSQQAELLRRAGLYPARNSAAHSWLNHWIASNQPRKPWIDVSSDGNQTLSRAPNPVI